MPVTGIGTAGAPGTGPGMAGAAADPGAGGMCAGPAGCAAWAGKEV